MEKGTRVLLELMFGVTAAFIVIALPKIFPMEIILAFLAGGAAVLVVLDAGVAYIMRKEKLTEKSLDFINFMAVFSARVRVAEFMLFSIFLTYSLFYPVGD